MLHSRWKGGDALFEKSCAKASLTLIPRGHQCQRIFECFFEKSPCTPFQRECTSPTHNTKYTQTGRGRAPRDFYNRRRPERSTPNTPKMRSVGEHFCKNDRNSILLFLKTASRVMRAVFCVPLKIYHGLSFCFLWSLSCLFLSRKKKRKKVTNILNKKNL